MRFGAVLISLILLSCTAHNPRAQEPVIQFPPGFRWCVATSSHQIEGNNQNSDWWDWEQIPGKIRNGEKSGEACDHWNHLDEDVGHLKELHVHQYRFSVEWAKLEPQPGVWDMKAVQHYREELHLLRQAGIEPMITLHHFTFPRWVREKGGWEWEGIAAAFGRFTGFVFSEIGPEVRDWITVNEPMVHLAAGYLSGATPPGQKRELKGMIAPLRGLLRAHAVAYHELHRLADLTKATPVRVGMAHHLRIFDPNWAWSPLDIAFAYWLDQAFNWALSESLESGRLQISMPFTLNVNEEVPELKNTQDFFGINYYSRDMVSFSISSPTGFELRVNGNSEKNDMGWEIYPEGFYRILKAVAQHFPGKPILVTENGLADSTDHQREKFLRDHLEAMAQAIQEGVPVEGYCHWSLMDNFEWTDGFSPRFGLFEVNYLTQSRVLRPSGRFFSDVAKVNSFINSNRE